MAADTGRLAFAQVLGVPVRQEFGCAGVSRTRTLPGMSAPPAEGARVAWQDVPVAVRTAVERVCGSAVIEAVTQPGGFSPGVAARVRCLDAAPSGPSGWLLHRAVAPAAAAPPADAAGIPGRPGRGCPPLASHARDGCSRVTTAMARCCLGTPPRPS